MFNGRKTDLSFQEALNFISAPIIIIILIIIMMMALNGFLGQLVFELSDKAAEGNELISKPGKIGDEENDVES